MTWHWWGVKILHVTEDAILATALSALSPKLMAIWIAGENLQAIDILADQGMTDTGQ